MGSPRLTALAGLLAVLVSGCSGEGPTAHGTPSPMPSGGLRVQLIGAGGPYTTGPPELVAARSEPELDALLQAVTPFFHRPDAWDGSAGVGGRVYLGIAVRFCTVLNSVSAQLTGRAVVTMQVNATGQCPPGAGAAAKPPMYLAAISVGQLPPAVVTFRRSDGGGQARVDLRPGQPSVDPSVVAAQTHDAVRAAFLQVGSGGSSRAIAELDSLQFPLSSTCNVAAATGPQQAGILVVVNEGPSFPSHEETFAWLAGTLTDCGTAP